MSIAFKDKDIKYSKFDGGGIDVYCLEMLSHVVCKIGTNVSKGLAAPSSGYIAGLIFYPEYRGC